MSHKPARVVFAGTPEFAVPCLEALHALEGCNVVAVLTQPDRPKGRGQKLQPSPVKVAATSLEIDIYQPESMKSDAAHAMLETLDADVMIVVAYGQILPQKILDTPTYGCINVHASILPRWRGAAPIQRAIEAGDTETGVSIMQMAPGLDTGPVYATQAIPITETMTTPALHDALAQAGARLLTKTLPKILSDQISAAPQSESKACYARKLEKSESLINWSSSATEIDRCIRAMQPWPVMQTSISGAGLRVFKASVVQHDGQHGAPGEVLKVNGDGFEVACGQGVLRIERVQPAGKKQMDAYAYANSRALKGEILG